MATCIEIELAPGRCFGIMAAVKDWDEVRAGAEVERVDELSGWLEWQAVYRVIRNGLERHYLVQVAQR